MTTTRLEPRNLEREWQSVETQDGKAETLFYDTKATAIAGPKGKGVGALGLRVRASGARAWIYEYRDAEGKTRRRTLGDPAVVPYEEAVTKRLHAAAGIQEGIYPHLEDAPTTQRPEGQTVTDLIDNLIEHHLRDPQGNPRRKRDGRSSYSAAYIEQIERSMGIARRTWGSRLTSDIVADDGRALVRFLQDYRDEHGDGAAHLLSVHLKVLFTRARADRLIPSNPMEGLAPVGVKGERERYLSDQELARLWPAMLREGYPGGDLMRLALLTGRRANEVAQAEWREFDLDRGLWILPGEGREGAAKNNRTHELALPPGAVALLRGCLERRNGNLVFHRNGAALATNGSHVQGVLKRLREATGADDWSIHTLRHTVSTVLQRLGCPIEVRAAILNHTLAGITSHYSHDAMLSQQREWLARLEAHIVGLVPPALPAPAPALPSPEAIPGPQ